MFDYFWFWISKTLAELVVGLSVLFLLALIMVLPAIWRWLKYFNCEHSVYRENRACHGICQKCSKDLGFIAPLRRDKSKREV
jgi:hypothetical protein